MTEGQTRSHRFSSLSDIEADSMSNYSPVSDLVNNNLTHFSQILAELQIHETEDGPPSYNTAQRQQQERTGRLATNNLPGQNNESSENVTLTHQHQSGNQTSLVLPRPNQNFQVIISDGGTVNIDNRNFGEGSSSPQPVDNKKKPTITDSDAMISEGMVQYVASNLGAHWRAVGRRLGVSAADIDYITADHHIESERAYHTIRKWYESEGKKASYKILAKALVDTHPKLYDIVPNISPDGIEV